MMISLMYYLCICFPHATRSYTFVYTSQECHSFVVTTLTTFIVRYSNAALLNKNRA